MLIDEQVTNQGADTTWAPRPTSGTPVCCGLNLWDRLALAHKVRSRYEKSHVLHGARATYSFGVTVQKGIGGGQSRRRSCGGLAADLAGHRACWSPWRE